MKRSIAELIGYLSGVLGVLGFVAQAFDLNSTYLRKGLWLFVAINLVIAITSLVRVRAYDNAVKCLQSVVDKVSPYKGLNVRYVQNLGELKELWELDVVCYGESNMPSFDTMMKWWQSYKHGIYILVDDNRIIGALGIWPLKKKPFLEILEGKRRERDIKPQSIQRADSVKGFNDWYISGIVLNTTFRKTRAIHILVSRSLSLWLTDGNVSSGVRLCAYAYTKNGENLLKRFGFRKYKDGRDTIEGWPVYLYEVSNMSELEQLCSRLAETSTEKR